MEQQAGPSREQLIAVKRKVFERINEDRQRHRCIPLLYDKLAAQVGEAHCVEMLQEKYLSHWNRLGYKPYHRYSFAGGADSVSENVSMIASTQDMHITLDDVIRNALRSHESMVAEQPPEDGHRRNILNSLHTHVGIGLAFHTRALYMAQEFVQRYMEWTVPLPRQANLNDVLALQGRLLHPLYRLCSIAVFYEKFPNPMSVEQLRATSSYGLPETAEYEHTLLSEGYLYQDGTKGSIEVRPDNSFSCRLRFRNKLPGLYTIGVWIDNGAGNNVCATTCTITVQSH